LEAKTLLGSAPIKAVVVILSQFAFQLRLLLFALWAWIQNLFHPTN